MTNEQIEAMLDVMIVLLTEARMEARALRQMLADYKVITETELDQRIEDVTREELAELKAEVYRRAFEKAAEDGPVQ